MLSYILTNQPLSDTVVNVSSYAEVHLFTSLASIGYILFGVMGKLTNHTIFTILTNICRVLCALSFFAAMLGIWCAHAYVTYADLSTNYDVFKYEPACMAVLCVVLTVMTITSTIRYSCAEACLMQCIVVAFVLFDHLIEGGIFVHVGVEYVPSSPMAYYLYLNVVTYPIYGVIVFLRTFYRFVSGGRPISEKPASERVQNDTIESNSICPLQNTFMIRVYLQFPLTLCNVLSLHHQYENLPVVNAALFLQCGILGVSIIHTIYYWREMSRFELPFYGLIVLLIPHHIYRTLADILAQAKAGVRPRFSAFALLIVVIYGIGGAPAAFAAGGSTIVPINDLDTPSGTGGRITAPDIGGGTPNPRSIEGEHPGPLGEGAGASGASGGAGRTTLEKVRRYIAHNWTGFRQDWTTDLGRTLSNLAAASGLAQCISTAYQLCCGSSDGDAASNTGAVDKLLTQHVKIMLCKQGLRIGEVVQVKIQTHRPSSISKPSSQ